MLLGVIKLPSSITDLVSFFMFSAVQFINILILTLLCVLLFNSVKVTELPPVWERAANLAYHLLFHSVLRYNCTSFP